MAKLLLVEDDNNLREIYEARLQAEGYTIVSAKDGEEALVVAKAELPDLIISDVMMPKISGFEMLDILRNTDDLKGVKVIMLTALGQSDDQQRADRLGADRYLVKSQVTLEDIVKVTHELLEDQPAAPAVPEVPALAAAAPAVPAPTTAVAEPAPAPAPAPIPEPITAEPAAAPEPAVQATPAVPATSVDTPSAVDTTADEASSQENAESTKEEAADVSAQIESFVAGASSEPEIASPSSTATPPAASDDASSEGFASTAPPKPADAPSPDVTAADDKLIQDAVKSFEDSASGTAPAAATTTVVSPDSSVSTTTTETTETAPAASAEIKPAVNSEETTSTGSVPIANKKVIEPLDTEPKKDINELLAVEEANEEASKPAPPPVAVIAADGAGPKSVAITETADTSAPQISMATSGTAPAEETTDTPEDPNSIAL